MRNILSILLFISLLGCSATNEKLITQYRFPELPEISIPSLNLADVEHDIPRDKSGAYDPESNLYRGFDKRNWNLFWSNDAKIQKHIHELRNIIKTINKQRQDMKEHK